MTNEKLIKLLKISYEWGRDNGSYGIERNFNELLQNKVINQALSLADPCKHEDYTCYYGSEGELMFKQCNTCKSEFD